MSWLKWLSKWLPAPLAKRGKGGRAKLGEFSGDRLSAAAVAAAAETARAMLNRPGVKASLESAMLRLVGTRVEPSGSSEAGHETADRIALILRDRRVPANRIGVDALPGSGKSTLARALAEKLDIEWKSLDHEDMDVPRDFAPEHTVYEHHRLFRTQNVDVFDAIVYVDESVEISKARVLQRARHEARGGMVIDVLDYDKLKQIGKLAFDVCEGDPVPVPGSSLLMKVRPPEGFRAVENIASRLDAAGHDVEKAQGARKEEMLFLLAYGRQEGGVMAYFLPGAYTNELVTGLLAGMRRYLAG